MLSRCGSTDGAVDMKHADGEIERAAERYRLSTETLDPDVTRADDLSDLRAVATAAEATHQDEARLRGAVEAARAHGRSWNYIAVAIGVSRQATRQRFGRAEEVSAGSSAKRQDGNQKSRCRTFEAVGHA